MSTKYLEKDLVSLFQIIQKANGSLFDNFNVQLTNCLTISRLAADIFLKKFNKDYISKIPYINDMTVFNDIHKAYFGGITEVYIPKGTNLFYYDVNSLYPYASYGKMPGLKTEYVDYLNKPIMLDESLFGFFYCNIRTSNGYLGLLPYRNKNRVIYPVGNWSGWYFSEELKFAQENGYKINVIKGYSFNRESDVFKEYVNRIYKIKSNPINKTQKSIAKSLLNNLLGRFGISLDKSVTEIVDEKRFGDISSMHKIDSYKIISKNNILVTYVPKLDDGIIKSHKLDITKLLIKYKDNEVQSLDVCSIAISAAVTAYGRIHMSKVRYII